MKHKIYQWTAALLILLVGGMGYFHTELRQLYHTVRLFEPELIIRNFSNMAQIFPSITIPRTGPVEQFKYRPQPLPSAFLYQGAEHSIQRWLSASSTTALVVLKSDSITFENYFQGTGESDARISWSMAKSFLSALFGVAVEEGAIADLNSPVTDYVPSLKGSGYDGVSIKDVLQMSSGVCFNEDYGDFNSDINRMGRLMALGGSFDEFAATLQRWRTPGTYMAYISIDTHVLGMVLRAATGQRISDYFETRLWSKLQPEGDAIYLTDSTGEPMVLGGLNLMSRDYLRFGKLYRDFGRLNGEQIIPAQWIEDSITPDAPHLVPGKRANASTHWGYGYQWWIPEHANQEFVAIGIYGQYIYINRKADVVIVKNSTDTHFMANHYESMELALAAFRAISDALTPPPS
ncbi:serine hydrolase domain-containing protein [Photobacterium sp. TY1-4]|uniref:serine hydrolase domain-containing protein n=1 Tax=Photobacterium sp. TY1-4 TaxID=2899122 RepID=UPI0021BEB283|nr:serine hydrolase [Photobacterium sp. TY1-4]UXI03517.1 beta-lactamase family protein [Photobacterium sp. TY1-4]